SLDSEPELSIESELVVQAPSASSGAGHPPPLPSSREANRGQPAGPTGPTAQDGRQTGRSQTILEPPSVSGSASPSTNPSGTDGSSASLWSRLRKKFTK